MPRLPTPGRSGQLGRLRRDPPPGVIGTLVALAISPPLGALGGADRDPLAATLGAERTAAGAGSVRRAGQWVMSAALAFSHGANDAQKAIGVIAALLLAAGDIDSLVGAAWVTVACSAALTLGHRTGRMAHHPDRGSAHLPHPSRRRPRLADGVGRSDLRRDSRRCADLDEPGCRLVVGWHRSRAAALHHVHWSLVRRMGAAWIVTLPDTAALAAALLKSAPGDMRHRRHESAGTGSCPIRPTWSGCSVCRSTSRSRAWTRSRVGGGRSGQGTGGPRRQAARRRAKRGLLDALRDAFVLPLEPEDLFTLSRGIDLDPRLVAVMSSRRPR